jgi:acyl-CoA thioester hydrolase
MAGVEDAFRERFRVGWGDLDGNNHMANRAFLDRVADVRFRFFAMHGFPGARFAAERVGPAIVRDELVYHRELRLSDEYSVDLKALGLSEDGSRFRIENVFRNSSEEVIARVVSEGVWFDLEKRRPRTPPPDLDAVQRRMPRAENYEVLPARRT